MAVKIQNQFGNIDISNDVIALSLAGPQPKFLELSEWQAKIRFVII